MTAWPGPGVATIEMKTSFVRPAEGELRALGKLLHRTATLGILRGVGARRRRSSVRPRHRHVQVPARVAHAQGRAQGAAPQSQTIGVNMATTNKRFVLASRPTGEPAPQNFRLEEAPLPTLKDGEVLVRHHYLSLDPYMRGRMSEGKSYAQPQALDAVMVGGTVGEVVESRQRQLQGRRQGGRLSAAGSSIRWSPPASPACCARSTPRACRCRPTSARSACRASPPGWA